MSKNANRYGVSRKATREMNEGERFTRRDIEKFETQLRKFTRLMKYAPADNV